MKKKIVNTSITKKTEKYFQCYMIYHIIYKVKLPGRKKTQNFKLLKKQVFPYQKIKSAFKAISLYIQEIEVIQNDFKR